MHKAVPRDFSEYERELRQWASVARVREYGRVLEGGHEYPLLCFETSGERTLVITAGFHGEEPAGPRTLATHLGEVVKYANGRRVALRVYPCINPSGFALGQRYNASGEHPNNDFIRYLSHGNELKEEVALGEPFAAWQLYDGGPKETQALRAELASFEAPAAALDLHQDAWVLRPCFYAYHFNDRAWFCQLTHRCVQWAKLGVNVAVHDQSHTDDCGLIIHHDGSVSDWYWRRGVRHVAVLETSTLLPTAACDNVNLEWIRGFIDLAAQ